MSTINDKGIIIQMLENDGAYPGDPQMLSIWSYVNQWGDPTHKICPNIQTEMAFLESGAVGLPELLWRREIGTTPAGSAMVVDS